MNRWRAIEDFYAPHRDAIESNRNEWVFVPSDCFSVIELTPIESWLWGDIREANAVFYPQWPVAGVFVDFANPAAKVAIECDGAAYHQDKAKDEARDEMLWELGWSVYRLTGKQCRHDCNEETGEPAYPRRLIDALAAEYGLTRSREGKKSFPYFSAPEVKAHALGAH